MAITLYFYLSNYRTFKAYYKQYVSTVLKSYFLKLVSYNRFVKLMQEALIPLILYMKKFRTGKCTGISFIDSTTLDVYYNKKIYSHKVYKGIVKQSKSLIGGFTALNFILLSMIKEEILFCLTPENIDDRDTKTIEKLTKDIYLRKFPIFYILEIFN
ncbi:hypothetical protein UT300018_16330 [Clostridium faecium]